MKIHVDVVSVEGEIFSGSASIVFAPAEMGEIGIMPRHAPLLTRLKPGNLRIRDENDNEEHVFVSGGLLEVQPHLITVMADTAERAEDIDEAEAAKAKERAEQAVSEAEDKIDLERAQLELTEAAARLDMVRRLRSPSR
ncbi:F0F1 ATP synthase subunit epsilon [Salinisphaera hydrothermalis]|uniref:ATP synthase epsilon chain n=1 Tax=Salinisphaera hydrothermalis (strain C41B8) TaxID=1304275 RepID=A0A084IM89_SALHC|nr:F0F1 ATP synthase subunit epsilon [Salinisphaera hydrothermalis]KEZ77823.1 ATP synthase F1 subunit epsilon [Salinisphaera hydrothermalis C41B8]